MAQAQGEWITFVDADDLLTPHALEAMLTVADDETDYIVGSVEKFGDVPTEVILQLTFGRSSESMDRVLCPAIWAQLFRRNIIADSGLTFREDLSYSEDTLFVYTYRHYIRQLATVGDVVYRYRINAASASFSSNLMKRATHHMIVANAFQQMIEQQTSPQAIKTLTFVRNKILSFVQNETKQVLTEKEGVSLQ
jgi:glycosyltransferase involved in cell wall biosynthesis